MDERQQFADALAAMYKALPSSTPGGQLTYENGGLFSVCGLNDRLITAVGIPQNTLATRLAAYPSIYTNDVVLAITGIDSGGGTEANGPCDDPPGVGQFRTCGQVWPFGRFSRQTPVIDISNVGEIANRGVNTRLRQIGGRRINNPMVPSGDMSAGSTGVAMKSTALYNGVQLLGLEFLRDFGGKLWNGNPTANTAGGGYKEFRGLQLLVNTGYTDALNNSTPCPSLDSDVRTFGSDIGTNGANAVQTLTNMYRNSKKRAEDTGMNPTELVFVMRWSLFMELTEVWPCSYMSYRCQVASGSQQFISATDQMALRDRMRGGNQGVGNQRRFLLIDGEEVEVVIDDFLPETRPDAAGAPNTYGSDIYMLPLTAAGNRDVLFFEYFDWSGPMGLMEAARAFGVESFYEIKDGGMFVIHHKPPNNFCVQMLALTKPRLVLETPFLAGRLQDVRYTPLKHEVSTIPGEPTYLSNGVTGRTI